MPSQGRQALRLPMLCALVGCAGGTLTSEELKDAGRHQAVTDARAPELTSGPVWAARKQAALRRTITALRQDGNVASEVQQIETAVQSLKPTAKSEELVNQLNLIMHLCVVGEDDSVDSPTIEKKNRAVCKASDVKKNVVYSVYCACCVCAGIGRHFRKIGCSVEAA